MSLAVQKRAPARYWSEQECKLFLQGIERFGIKGLFTFSFALYPQPVMTIWVNIDTKSIADLIGTRTVTQVRSHMQKYLAKKKKEECSRSNSPNDAVNLTSSSPMDSPHSG